MDGQIEFYDEPFTPILYLAKSEGRINVPRNDSLFEIFTQIKYPIYNDEQIELVRTKLKQGESITKILNEIEFTYPYIHQIVESLLENPGSHGKYGAISLFLTFIGWVSYSLEHLEFSFGYSFLNALLSDTALLYPSISISVFTYIYNLIITKDPNFAVKYLHALKFFFMNSTKYPKQVVSMLDNSFKKVFQSKTMTSQSKELFINTVEATEIAIETHPEIFTQDIADTFISYISFQVIELELFSIQLFAKLLTYTAPNQCNSFIQTLAPYFTQKFRENDQNIWPESKNTTILSVNLSYGAEYCFSNVVTFQNGFHPLNKTNLPLIKEYSQLFTKETNTLLVILDDILTSSPLSTENFLKNLISDPELKSIMLYTAFFHLVEKHAESIQNVAFTADLLKLPLFDPGINYKTCENFETISTLRDKAFARMLAEGSESVQKTLTHFMTFPILLAEFFIRCEKNLFKVSKMMLGSKQIIRLIRDTFIMLRNQNMTYSPPDDIETARERLYSFFIALMEKSNMRNLILREPMFLSAIVLGFYEEVLWPETTIFIQNYVCDDIRTDAIMEALIQGIASSFSNEQFTERYVNLINHIIQLILNLITVQPSIISHLKYFVKNLTTVMTRLPAEDSYIPTLEQYISFIIDYSLQTYLHGDVLQLIPSIFNHMFNKNYPESFFMIFKKMIICNNVHIVDYSKTIICKSLFVKIVMKIVDQSSMMIPVLEYFSELMKFSDENITKFHEGELDSFIISLLYQSRSAPTEIYTSEQMDEMLNVVSKIAMFISNPNVVKQFVSLLCPLTNLMLCKYHPKFIKTLDYILTDVYRKHELTAINDKDVLHASMNKKIGNGFTAICWLSIREIFNYQVFMSIVFAMEKTTFAFSLINDSLRMTILRPTSTDSLNCEIQLPDDIFHLITITFKKSKSASQWTVHVKVNNFQKSIGNVYLSDDAIITDFTLGFRKSYPSTSNFEIISGGLFPMISPQQQTQFLLNGPLHDNYPTAYAYFKSKPKSMNTVTEYATSFADTLISLWKFDLIIPLFALFNFNFADGSFYSLAPSLSLSIIMKAALSSEEGLRDFTKDNKIGYISYLLTLYRENIISYELYQQFFTFYQLTTLTELKDQIFSEILINLNIWYVCADILLILKHWVQILIIINPKFFDYIGFSDIIEILRVYFWYIPKDGDICGAPSSKRPRCSNIDIEGCRYQMAQILDYLHSIEPAKIDLNSLLSSCFKIPDSKQIQHLLFIFELLLQKTNVSGTNEIKIQSTHIVNLIELISTNDESTIRSILRIIGIIQIKNLTTPYLLSFYINLSINNLNTEVLSTEIFNEVKSLFTGNIYSFLPFMAWYGCFAKYTEEVQNLLSTVKPNENYNFMPGWFLWPIIFCAVNPGNPCVEMLMLISQIFHDMKKLLMAIDFTCGSLGELGTNFRPQVFLTILDLIITEKLVLSKNEKDETLNYLIFTILFKWNPSTHPTLEIENEVEEQKFEMSGSFLFQNIAKLGLQKYRTQFGLYFDQNHAWKDFELAKKVLILVPESAVLSSFLTSILKHLEPDFEVADYQPYNPLNLELIDDVFKDLYEKNSYVLNDVISKISEYASFVVKTSYDHPYVVDIVNEVANYESLYMKRLLEEKSSNHDRWSRLWSALRSDGGPWDPVRGQARTPAHKKRDNIDCFAYCPFRFCTNHHYTNHADATYRSSDRKEPIKVAPKRKRSSSVAYSVEDTEPESSSLLVENADASNDSIIKQAKSAKQILSLPCKIHKPKSVKNGIFQFFEDRIYIVKEDSIIVINNDDVSHIYLRSKYHKLTAIEIFTCNTNPLFIDFERPVFKILSKLSHFIPSKVQVLPFAQHFNMLQITEDWVNCKISNFAYLMLLNVLSGRSFNDLAQYPIFPWIVFDITSKTLDFSDPTTFRDFSKPVGALNQKNLDKLINMADEQQLTSPNRYLYSSGPISRLVVCLYLLRIEPFASIHIELQSGHFDCPDRLVISYAESLRVVMSIINDYRELIPEFFYSPEFLINSNGYDLGEVRGKKVDGIEIPPWANNPMDFIYKHRKALESNYVSQNIKNWIDLVWGYKQRGVEAEKAFNQFDPKLYEDVWKNIDKYSSTFDMSSLEEFLSMIGQIPAQIFTSPHPQKKILPPTVLPFSDTLQLPALRFVSIEDNTLALIDECGSIIIYSIKQTPTKIEVSEHSRPNLPPNYLKMFDNPEKLLFATNSKGTIVIANKACNGVFTLQFGSNLSSLNQIAMPQNKPVRVSTCGSWMLVCGNDSTTSVFRSVHRAVHSLQYTTQSYKNNAICSCINDTFKVQIIGSDDGTLTVSSLGTGQIIHIIDLGPNCTPRRVHVTPQWGFIVVEYIKQNGAEQQIYLSVYNINGYHIKEIRIGSKIVSWTFWSSVRGFDYMCTINEKGSISISEVYYLSFSSLSRTMPNAIYVKFIQSIGAIIAASREGAISFIPFYDKEDW